MRNELNAAERKQFHSWQTVWQPTGFVAITGKHCNVSRPNAASSPMPEMILRPIPLRRNRKPHHVEFLASPFLTQTGELPDFAR